MFELSVRAGGLSFAPLLLFTVWFLFTAQQELIHVIPARLRTPTKCILMGCIPLIVISTTIGAFVGISYRKFKLLPRFCNVTLTLLPGTLGDGNAVGFLDEKARLLWTFFNLFSLALLVVFEVVAFFLLFARGMKVILHRRRSQSMGGMGEIHRFGGTILMNLGILLSLVETLIGFAPQSFTLEITRRGVKTVGRILIILGLLKG
jgi:hypothetical protein